MRSTPYPNRLLEVSTKLPETQLRLLNYVVRYTLGWQGETPGERKAETTVTIGQLKKRLARSSTLAVAEALAALIQMEVIEVRSDLGTPFPASLLATSRRHTLHLSLVRSWVEEK